MRSVSKLFAKNGQNPAEMYEFANANDGKSMRINRWVIARQVEELAGKDFLRDVRVLIACSVATGNNLTALPDMSLISKYHLKSRAKKRSSNEITLCRIAASFPKLACEYMRISANPVISINQMRQMSADYPSCLMHFSFPSLIPLGNQDVSNVLLHAHMLFQARFAVKNTDPSVAKSDAQIRFQCKQFAESIMNEEYYTEWQKINLLTDWGLLVNGYPSEPVYQAAERYLGRDINRHQIDQLVDRFVQQTEHLTERLMRSDPGFSAAHTQRIVGAIARIWPALDQPHQSDQLDYADVANLSTVAEDESFLESDQNDTVDLSV